MDIGSGDTNATGRELGGLLRGFNLYPNGKFGVIELWTRKS
jgi:hypothetical protein